MAAAAAQDGKTNGAAWNDYIYSGDEFAISAPAAPIVERQNVRGAGGNTEAHVYTVPTADDGAFMVFVLTRNASDQRSDQKVLDEARIGALRAANAIVIVQSNITLGPYRGSQIDLETQNGEASAKNQRIRDRFFVVGRRLYQLMAVAPAGEPLPVGTGQWLDSFRLVAVPGGSPTGNTAGETSCNDAVGAKQAATYVSQCKEVSPATHPPCNAANACALIIAEIRRGCGFIGTGAPHFCAAYK